MSSLIEKLQKSYNNTTIGAFALEYSLYRSTIPVDDKISKDARLHHLLHLQHIPHKAFRVYDFPNGTESSISSIRDADINDYKTLMAQKMAALWTPRFTVTISKGASFEIGDGIVRIGEVRAEGTSQAVRSVLVAIQIPSAGDIKIGRAHV